MGQASEWRDKAAYYWSLSKTVMNYDLCEQYAELAARYLDMAERLEDLPIHPAAPGRQLEKR